MPELSVREIVVTKILGSRASIPASDVLCCCLDPWCQVDIFKCLIITLLIITAIFKCCRLEQCLKEMNDYAHELSSGELQCSEDAMDALKQISDSRLIDKHTCCDVNMECVQQMLKQMVSTSLVMMMIGVLIKVKGKGKAEHLYSALHGTNHFKALRHGSHSF